MGNHCSYRDVTQCISAVSLGTNDGVIQADEHTDATVIPDITVDTGTVDQRYNGCSGSNYSSATTNNAATDQAAQQQLSI